MIRLNLLPEGIKDEIRFAKNNYKISQNFMRVVLVFLILFATQIVMILIFKTKESAAIENKNMALEQNLKWKDIEAQSKDFADRLTLIKKIENENINWQIVFDEIAKCTPENIMLDSLNFPSDTTKNAKLTGVALTDKDVATYRQLLAESEIFEFVDIESISEGSDPLGTDREMRAFVFTTKLVLDKVKSDE